MSKKLELNGLWESSRMMLPQHKESAIRNRRESQRIMHPIRDEQEIQKHIKCAEFVADVQETSCTNFV